MSIAWRMMKEGIRSVAVLLLILTLTIDNGYAQRKKQRQTQPPERIVLADEGATRYRIVLPSSPSEHEKQAAEVLRRYLLQISGTAFPIVGVQEGRTSASMNSGHRSTSTRSVTMDLSSAPTVSGYSLQAAPEKGRFMVSIPSWRNTWDVACTVPLSRSSRNARESSCPR
jgi:hypothetical protein